jgi:hypothetical protein
MKRRLDLLEPCRIGQHFSRERLPLCPVRDTDEARMPDAIAVGLDGFYHPVRSREATKETRLDIAVTLSWFDRAFCHPYSLHRLRRQSEARHPLCSALAARRSPSLAPPTHGTRRWQRVRPRAVASAGLVAACPEAGVYKSKGASCWLSPCVRCGRGQFRR